MTKPVAILNSCNCFTLLQLIHLLAIGMSLISAVLSLDELLSQTEISCAPKCYYQ